MSPKELSATKDALLDKMADDGYSQQMIEKNRWVLDVFMCYCETEGITDISISSASDFIRNRFGFDVFNPSIPIQSAIRHPLFMLFEFGQNGTYVKAYHKLRNVDIPPDYDLLFREYAVYVDGTDLKRPTQLKKLMVFAKYAGYLDSHGISDIHNATRESVYGFMESLDGYAPKSLRGYRVNLRSLLDWLHGRGDIPFSGHDAIPVIRDETRSKLMSYYSKEEIEQILSSIDTRDRSGKFAYCAVSFFVYLGMREGDVIRLKFSDIDWKGGAIRFCQHKTGDLLTLPLLDEVRYPLIDYIKNARPASGDTEHIFITVHAPHRAYAGGAVLYNIVKDCIKKSGIDPGDRHRGPHALRHSLATNLMSGNVPVSGISDILGHTSTLTTEIYLTIDETHLKEISLEVPNA